MDVKLRKVGNSFVVTIPLEIIERLNMHEGDKLTMKDIGKGILYEKKTQPTTIDWDKYTNFNNSKRATNPVSYVRELRENDRI